MYDFILIVNCVTFQHLLAYNNYAYVLSNKKTEKYYPAGTPGRERRRASMSKYFSVFTLKYKVVFSFHAFSISLNYAFKEDN